MLLFLQQQPSTSLLSPNIAQRRAHSATPTHPEPQPQQPLLTPLGPTPALELLQRLNALGALTNDGNDTQLLPPPPPFGSNFSQLMQNDNEAAVS